MPKKIVFTKVKDKNAMENIAHTNLYDFNNGDDMFQLTKKEKESYLQTFSSFSSIYEMTFEYVKISPEKIQIKEKSGRSDVVWSLSDDSVTEWYIKENAEWKLFDEEKHLSEVGFHTDGLYRKINDCYVHEANSRCNFGKQEFIIAKLVDDLFDKQIKNILLFQDVE